MPNRFLGSLPKLVIDILQLTIKKIIHINR